MDKNLGLERCYILVEEADIKNKWRWTKTGERGKEGLRNKIFLVYVPIPHDECMYYASQTHTNLKKGKP